MGGATVKINSPHLGSLDIDAQKIIEFPKGLPGFEECKRFSLFHDDGKDPIVFTLQSVDQPDVALSITDPTQFGLHYELTLSDDDASAIGLRSIDDVAVAVIVRRSDPAATRRVTDARISANLMAPIVINTRERRGLQQIIARSGCDITLKAAGA
jgi:flagellar assembly factor FliW